MCVLVFISVLRAQIGAFLWLMRPSCVTIQIGFLLNAPPAPLHFQMAVLGTGWERDLCHMVQCSFSCMLFLWRRSHLFSIMRQIVKLVPTNCRVGICSLHSMPAHPTQSNVHKIQILSSFTHPHVVPNLSELLSSEKLKKKKSWKYISNGKRTSQAVNMCSAHNRNDSGEKTAVKKASEDSDVDTVCLHKLHSSKVTSCLFI